MPPPGSPSTRQNSPPHRVCFVRFVHNPHNFPHLIVSPRGLRPQIGDGILGVLRIAFGAAVGSVAISPQRRRDRRQGRGCLVVFHGPTVFTGHAHPELAQNICSYLGQDLGESNVFDFSNGNIFVQLQENVRERDVFIVQPAADPVNNSFMELLIMIDAARRASAGRITAVMPYHAALARV